MNEKQLLRRELVELLGRHGIDFAVVTFRDGRALTTLGIADEPFVAAVVRAAKVCEAALEERREEIKALVDEEAADARGR